MYPSGTLKPTKAQLAEARRRAVMHEFCNVASEEFNYFCPEMRIYGESTHFHETVLLKSKSVQPHTDPWLGSGLLADCNTQRNIFWLMHSLSGSPIYLQVGNDARKMYPGDWVVFDDSVMHSVVSDVTWLGAATQVSKIIKDETEEELVKLETVISRLETQCKELALLAATEQRVTHEKHVCQTYTEVIASLQLKLTGLKARSLRIKTIGR